MKAISYSIFGAAKERYQGCFDFNSYLRGLLLNIRFNKLVYPDWENAVMVEAETYEKWKNLFEFLNENRLITMDVCENNTPLCKAMLWRMKPLFWKNPKSGHYRFSHIICRDLDSLCTYREAQAVQIWMDNDKGAHAITDSVSHTIPMMGGMIGFKPHAFAERVNVFSFEDMINLSDVDFIKKGSDQIFLNNTIYPKFAIHGDDSITQHYFKGHGNTWLSDFHICLCWVTAVARGHAEACPENVTLNLPETVKETNEISQHIGAAGYNSIHVHRLLKEHAEEFKMLTEIEKNYPEVFYWNNL